MPLPTAGLCKLSLSSLSTEGEARLRRLSARRSTLALTRISPNLFQNLPARAARENFQKICLYHVDSILKIKIREKSACLYHTPTPPHQGHPSSPNIGHRSLAPSSVIACSNTHDW